jgi:hypothetical protein
MVAGLPSWASHLPDGSELVSGIASRKAASGRKRWFCMTVQETAQAFLDLTAADEAELRARRRPN